MSTHHFPSSRRKFVRQLSCAAMGYTTLFSGLINIKAIGAAAAANSATGANPNTYKALVCLLLEGGSDSFNMLVPRGANEYAEYAAIRSNLALPRNSLLPINPLTPDGRAYGLHPALPGLQRLFAEGKVAFVANVGSLIEKVENTDRFFDGSRRLPLGLYSHSDQLAHWQTAIPQTRTAIGWGGRMADLLRDMNNNQKISLNISLSGTNLFQSGVYVQPYTIENTGTGSTGIGGYEDEDDYFGRLKRAAIDSLMEHHYQDLFKNTYTNTIKTAQRSHEVFSTAIGDLPPLSTPFPDTELGRSLGMVARTIAIRNNLAVSRQCFFINYGDWDHHDELTNNLANNLSEVDGALAAFQTALEELGVANNVTTFTISDFGRTLTSNGNGTDHGWGGHALVMGGSVNGGDFYGTYPELQLNNSLELGSGVFIPTTAADEYLAELALWFGVAPGDLDTVLPNIRNFYAPTAGAVPLGIMQMT